MRSTESLIMVKLGKQCRLMSVQDHLAVQLLHSPYPPTLTSQEPTCLST
ncbi:unnamed protein product [Chrysoparadoxa australica]